MASEYTLRLKAALDTSEVQQELSKLRSTSAGGPAGKGGASAAATSNLGSLGTTLTKINTALAQLNQTLSRMAMQQKTMPMQTAVRQPVVASPALAMNKMQPIVPFALSKQQSGGGVAQSLGQQIQNYYGAREVQKLLNMRPSASLRQLLPDVWNRFAASAGISELEKFVLQAREGSLKPSELDRAKRWLGINAGASPMQKTGIWGAFAAGYPFFGNSFPEAKGIRHNLQQRLAADLAIGDNSLYNRREVRWGGLAAAALAREFMAGRADLYEARGDIESAKALRAGQSFIDKTAMYGAGGFMVGGPMGAAVGAGVGIAAATLETVFKSLAESARQLANDLKGASQAVKVGQAVDKALADQQTQLQQRRALKSGDVGKMQSVLQGLETDRAAALAGMAEVDAEGGLAKYARKTQTLIQLRGTKGTDFELSEQQYAENEKEIKRRKKVAEEYEKQASELMKLNASIEQFNSAIEAAKQAAEDAKQRLAEEGALAEEAEIASMTELGMRIEAGRKGLKQYDLLEKDSREIFNKSQSGVQSSLDQAQKAALEARARYESKLDEAERAPDSQLRAGLLEDAQEAMRDWQFEQSRADRLNEAMRDFKIGDLQELLSKLAAPDMTSTNSLANSGYMINRSDDAARLEAMNNYEQTQVELQRQIKDILETKSFAATAG